MIVMQGIRKEYHMGDNVVAALDGVDIHIKPHEFVSIIGPSGSGKSTLMNIIGCLDTADEGTYIFDGQEISDYSEDELATIRGKKIGFVFQNSEVQLFTDSVEHEIAFGLDQLGLPEEEVRAKTEQAILEFHLEKVRERAPFHISGGEQKRTAMAAVFAMEPLVIVLDEPLSGLDEEGQDFVRGLLKKKRDAGTTLVVATHSRELAEDLADLRIRMDRSHRIVDIG